ncbi:MAG: hypothetical protein P4L41_15875 [Flavipsychrobacter sp.]|nr:hypothetical protein [Flavipsychrobacter sp.]
MTINFFPSDNYYITTKLSKAEVQQKLEAEADTARTAIGKSQLFAGIAGARFMGTVDASSFVIEPMFNYRQSIQIKGNVQDQVAGSRIKISTGIIPAQRLVITMPLVLFTSIFLYFWLADKRHVVFFQFGFFMIAVYVLGRGNFNKRNRQVKEALTNYFDGAIEQTER